jgi:hypothetical protein
VRHLSVLVLAGALSCTEDGAVLEVTMAGDLGAVHSLRVTTWLRPGQPDEKKSRLPDPQVRRTLDSFLVKLPAATTGEVRLAVGALGAGGCQIASGRSTTRVSGPGRYPLTVSLADDPGCRVVVEKSGGGSGTVTASLPGLLCPAGTPRCSSAPFPIDTDVVLTATPDQMSYPGSIFAGWGGVACRGTAPCRIRITDAPLRVEAAFLPRKVCSEGWCWENPQPQGNRLNGIWGSAAADVWAVGDYGTILHWNGDFWSASVSGTPFNLNGIWGNRADDVWAVGQGTNEGSTILHWDGTGWSPVQSESKATLQGVWGSAPDDVWAVGESTILHWDGSAWSIFPSGAAELLDSVWGSGPDDVWAAGVTGTILHWDGRSWRTGAPAATAGKVWGAGKDDVWTQGGLSGTILHWTGGPLWIDTPSGTTKGITGFWGSSYRDVWAVGLDGTILHWNGALWSPARSGTTLSLLSVWGSGAHDVWAVGFGAILHWNGVSWNAFHSSVTASDLNGVWGDDRSGEVWAVGGGISGKGTILRFRDEAWIALDSGAPNLYGVWGHRAAASNALEVWAVGDGGTVLRSTDGVSFTDLTARSGTRSSLYGVWGTTPAEIWAVGAGGTVLRWDGSTWRAESSGTMRTLWSGWGSSGDDVWAVGDGGTALRRTGGAWSRVPTPKTYRLAAIWGSGARDVWAVGDFGVVLHWDGAAFTEIISPTPFHLKAVAATGPSEIWAVGDQGTVLRFSDRSSQPALVYSGTANGLLALWASSRSGAAWTVGTGGTILSHHR